MVKYLKRNFITALLLACVIFSFMMPIAAADTETQVYNRVKWIGTEVMQPIKDVVEGFTGAYTGLADGLYDAYLEVFKNGGTDKDGNVSAGAVPIINDLDSIWIPCKLISASIDEAMPNYKPNLHRIDDFTVNLSINYLEYTNGFSSGAYSFNRNLLQNNAPFSGNYYRYFSGSSTSGFKTFGGSPLNTLQFYGHVAAGSDLGQSHTISYSKILDDAWHNETVTYSLYFVCVPDNGTKFTGFGGGQTRGGGAGRTYNLIPAVEADGIAVGSGVSRDDVLVNYALFDEGTKVVSIPQADGSTINYTANTWVYNYETRTYNITTTNSTTVNITYGDDKATVTDGVAPPVDYYYTAPVAPSGGSGDNGGDDGGGGGFWDTILGGLADAILGFFKAVGVVAASIFEGLVNLLTDAVTSIGKLIGLVGSLGAVVGGFFAFLPVEVQAAVSAGLIVVITFSVISIIRK